MVVRRHHRRSNGSAAGAEGIRTGRYRSLPGANAVPQRNRAGVGRTRRCGSLFRHDAERKRTDRRGADHARPIRRTCSSRCWRCAAASARSASWLSDMARRFNLPDFVPRDGGRPTALIDLSKPSYRLGTAEIRVGWKPHRLDVHVAADRASFAVREQAHVKIHVARADGKAVAAPAPKSRSRPSMKRCSNSRRTRAGICSTR